MTNTQILTRPDAPPADAGVHDTPEALDKATIAALSPRDIARMTRDELQQVIRAAEVPLLPSEILDRMRHYDRATLERLVYLARQSCRHEGHWPSLLAR